MEVLYTACREGRHEDCQEYSAVDRCSCPHHTEDAPAAEEDAED